MTPLVDALLFTGLFLAGVLSALLLRHRRVRAGHALALALLPWAGVALLASVRVDVAIWIGTGLLCGGAPYALLRGVVAKPAQGRARALELALGLSVLSVACALLALLLLWDGTVPLPELDLSAGS